MTEEEAFEKIQQISDEYYKSVSSEYIEDVDVVAVNEVPSSVLKSLLNIAINQPAAVNKAVEVCNSLLHLRQFRGITMDYGKLLSTAKCLTRFMDKRPELKEEVLRINDIIFNKIASSDFDNFVALRNFGISFQILDVVTENNPELSDSALSVIKRALQSAYGENKHFHEYDSDLFSKEVYSNGAIFSDIFYEDMCKALEKIVKLKPEFAGEVWCIIRNSLQSDKSGNILANAHSILVSVMNAEPDLVNEIYDAVSNQLHTQQNSAVSHLAIYQLYCNIMDVKPELTNNVLQDIRDDLKSNPADKYEVYYGMACIYNTLCSVIVANQEYVDDVFDIIKTTSPQMNGILLRTLCSTLNGEASIETNPKLAGRLYETISSYLKSNNLDYDYSADVYKALGSIMKAKPDMADTILNMCPICANPVNARDGEFDNVYLALIPYVKHLSLEEAVTKHPEMTSKLQIAHKGRFASDKEFMYALEHFDKKTLAESMIFRAQQRVMNVLVSTSAQESGISKEDTAAFRRPDAPKEIKDYMQNNHDWLIPASFKGAAIFKEYFPAYIKQIQNHNRKNPNDALLIHDAVYWLPELNMSQEENARFAEFIRNNIIYQNAEHQMVHRPLSELKIIAHNWKALEKRLQKQNKDTDITKLKYSDVLSVCLSVKYENQRNDVFAAEAAKHGVNEKYYHNCEDIYLAGLKVPEAFDSKKEFKEGKYTGRFLPRDDVRTGFFGDYTDCCQHFGGVGNSCAVSTVKHPFSQLFVIEDEKGKIIAGSWTWENTEGEYREVCFDNIESLGELKQRPEINLIYEQVGKYLTEEQNCRRVTIGLGYQDADVSDYQETKAIALPRLYGNDGTNSYSDARSQVLLSENEKAEPLDKSQESQRYIRDVCCLDKAAMERVSNAVFPDSDKELQAPDNMAGFVIEDREKGVVGYCLYNIEEKSIYDMAVLPEYRTDKNASSKKLFAEMMRVIREEGGQWSAEMRDKTTLKYLEIMAQRGLVKFERHGVDHVMSDDSQVVEVTFEPIRDDVRQATNKLKDRVEEATAKTVDIKANTDNKKHGAGIIIDSNAREA